MALEEHIQNENCNDDNMELERMIETTKALLTVNKEIWDRCRPHHIQTASQIRLSNSSGESRAYHQGDNKRPAKRTRRKGVTIGPMDFLRTGFDRVFVATRGYEQDQSGQSNEYNSISISALATRTVHSFDALPPIPQPLASIVAVSESGISGLNGFFEAALLLDDDILLPFLVILKHHFQELHVLLGKIEAWLTEIQVCQNFLMNEFGADPSSLIIKDEEEIDHPKNTKFCVRCAANASRWPHKLTSDQQRCCHEYIFHLHLKSFKWDDSNHSHTFQIDSDSARSRLLKFMEFVTS